MYFYLIGHQRPHKAFSALSIEEHSSSEEGESDQTQELKQGLTREDQLSGRTNNNKKFRSFKSKENIHKKEVRPRPLRIYLPNIYKSCPLNFADS